MPTPDELLKRKEQIEGTLASLSSLDYQGENALNVAVARALVQTLLLISDQLHRIDVSLEEIASHSGRI